MKEFYITKFDQITLILREANDAKKNSEYLNERGVISKPFPITSIKYKDYSSSKILNHKYNYAVITSPKAIKVLDNIVSNNKTAFLKSSKIFTIGLETKDKLNKISFSNVLNANSNSESLIELILENTCQSDFGLWIAATDRSVDLKEILTKRNRKIEILEAYRTLPILKLSKPIKQDLINYKQLNLIVLSSRNVSITKDILDNYNLFKEVNIKSTLFVNSNNVAQKAKNLGWLNIKIIKKNFTKDILDYILELPK